MENYNNEREHDLCLISLVGALDEAGQLDIFRDAFRIEEDLGPLRWSGRRRAFDVELEFANLSVAIETKVHSNEDGGDGEQWQTERIAEQRRGVKGQNFFITYGTSEFYTKPYEPGPASPEFQHMNDPSSRVISGGSSADRTEYRFRRVAAVHEARKGETRESSGTPTFVCTVPYALYRGSWRERLPERPRSVFRPRASFSRLFKTGGALG